MEKFLNKHVIVRADKAGVFFGILESFDGTNVIMKDVRKLFRWSGASAVEQLSLDGVARPKNCKFTVVVKHMFITNADQVIPCTNKAIDNLKSVAIWKQ